MSARNQIIRVGIAGQGRSGYDIHAAWLRQDSRQFKIVAVADQLPERRRDAEEQLGATAYADYRDMLASGGFDLFINALPSQLHVPATLEALSKKYHVVCEKPLARNVQEFDRMVTAARKAGRMLAPFQNNRFQPFFQKMLEITQSGVLGDIVAVRSVWGGFGRRWDWQTLQCNRGGSLFNTGPHAVDQGPMYSISGTHGGLTGNSELVQWKYYNPAKAPKPEFWRTWSENRKYPGETLPWIEKNWTVSDTIKKGGKSGYTLVSYQSAVKTFYHNIHEVLHNRDKLLITLPQVRRQIAIIEECHRQNPLPRKWNRWVPGKGGVK